MASYLRPKRGKKFTAEFKGILLKKGEIFCEVPDTGVGTGMGKIKMGDGKESYESLPYYIESSSDISETEINFDESTENDNSVLLNNIISNTTLRILFSNIKKLIRNLYNSMTVSNNNLNEFKFGVTEDGKYGYIKPGEMDVTPFKYASGTATPDKVLTGYTFSNDSDNEGLDGTMRNHGAINGSINAGGSYTVPEGYHNGYGKITANNLSGQTSATATANDIMNGKTGYVNGNQVTGNITELGGGYYTPNSNVQTIWCAGRKMTGNVVINRVANLLPENIKKGEWVGGVRGTWIGYKNSYQSIVSADQTSGLNNLITQFVQVQGGGKNYSGTCFPTGYTSTYWPTKYTFNYANSRYRMTLTFTDSYRANDIVMGILMRTRFKVNVDNYNYITLSNMQMTLDSGSGFASLSGLDFYIGLSTDPNLTQHAYVGWGARSFGYKDVDYRYSYSSSKENITGNISSITGDYYIYIGYVGAHIPSISGAAGSQYDTSAYVNLSTYFDGIYLST